tara:strand:+ start:6375 stop:7931 length:1557 start_codon:yes stop_codon:yes gene_type:complete
MGLKSGRYTADKFKQSISNPTQSLKKQADLDFGIYLGEIIVRPKDDTNSGRLTVWLPALGKDRDNPSNYVNAYWSSPFAGSTPGNKIGDNLAAYVDTQKTYGMWMVPPDPGNWVLICFADGKSKFPFCIGCLFPDQMQNMVPGLTGGKTFGTDIKLPVGEVNRGTPDIDHGKNATRPLHPYITKPILDQGLILDPLRGVSNSGARRESPSRVYGISTPGPEYINLDTAKKDGTHRGGGHSFVMDDGDVLGNDQNIRIRTGGGNQILMDDTNGLIYVINAKGTAWIELGADGDIQIYSEKDINYRAMGNINMRAEKNINIDGNVAVNINAGVYGEAHERVTPEGEQYGMLNINAGAEINAIAKKDFKLTADDMGSMHVLSKNNTHFTAQKDAHYVAKGATFLSSADGTHIRSGSETNIESGGLTNVLGSEVHLNDGGGATNGQNAKTVLTVQQYIIQEEENKKPDWEYEFQDTTEDNPLPSQGKRNGDALTTKSIIPELPTREPWSGHLTRDKDIETDD